MTLDCHTLRRNNFQNFFQHLPYIPGCTRFNRNPQRDFMTASVSRLFRNGCYSLGSNWSFVSALNGKSFIWFLIISILLEIIFKTIKKNMLMIQNYDNSTHGNIIIMRGLSTCWEWFNGLDIEQLLFFRKRF